MAKIQDNSSMLYSFKISVYRNGVEIEKLFWNDLPYRIRVKYDWYFEYRAALLRVKYPMCRHEVFMGSYLKETKNIIKITEIRLKKAINKVENTKDSIEMYKLMYNGIFPIEDDPDYQKALQVLNNKINNVAKIQEELNQLKLNQ